MKYYEQIKKDRDLFKFCLIGDGGVGKTTFVNYLRTGKLLQDSDAPSTTRTPFVNIDGCSLGGHILQIYDLAGQRRKGAHPLDYMQEVVLKEVDKILLFFALDNLESFLNIRKWFKELEGIYKGWDEETPSVFLIGNKLDLPRKVEAINGESLVERVEAIKFYHEISLASGLNVAELLRTLCKELDVRQNTS